MDSTPIFIRPPATPSLSSAASIASKKRACAPRSISPISRRRSTRGTGEEIRERLLSVSALQSIENVAPHRTATADHKDHGQQYSAPIRHAGYAHASVVFPPKRIHDGQRRQNLSRTISGPAIVD